MAKVEGILEEVRSRLNHLETHLEGEISSLRSEINSLRREIYTNSSTQVGATGASPSSSPRFML